MKHEAREVTGAAITSRRYYHFQLLLAVMLIPLLASGCGGGSSISVTQSWTTEAPGRS